MKIPVDQKKTHSSDYKTSSSDIPSILKNRVFMLWFENVYFNHPRRRKSNFSKVFICRNWIDPHVYKKRLFPLVGYTTSKKIIHSIVEF